jgi:hypothetical protein
MLWSGSDIFDIQNDHLVWLKYVVKLKLYVKGGSLTLILHSKTQAFWPWVVEGLKKSAIFFPFWDTCLAMVGLQVH